jgi:YolD-like protein
MKHEFAGMDNIKDRGIVKWQGFFMTEHRGELRNFAWNFNTKTQPELAEDRKDDLDETVNHAMANRNDVMVLVFSRGTYRELSGKIERLDPINGTLNINGQPIEIDRIIDVRITE